MEYNEFGQREKVFGSSLTHHCEFFASKICGVSFGQRSNAKKKSEKLSCVKVCQIGKLASHTESAFGLTERVVQAQSLHKVPKHFFHRNRNRTEI